MSAPLLPSRKALRAEVIRHVDEFLDWAKDIRAAGHKQQGISFSSFKSSFQITIATPKHATKSTIIVKHRRSSAP